MANRLGFIQCPDCGFADAYVNESGKTRLAYVKCPKCNYFTRGTSGGDKKNRAAMHAEPKGAPIAKPKGKPGRPRKPKQEPQPKQPNEPGEDEPENIWDF
jgi:hypothetical protein